MTERLIGCGLLALLVSGCPGGGGVPDGGSTKLPPQVFLTIDDTNVIGTQLSGKVNVSGCKTVTQVQLLEHGQFLADLNYTTSPTPFTEPMGLFAALYSKLGIAADLSLAAKVVCDDGRTNTSQAQAVSFFPIESRVSTGDQLVPDTFTATGGLSGTKVTMIGCVGTSSGAVATAAFDTTGQVVYSNSTLQVPCSSTGMIVGPRSKTTGTRWLMEPGKGVMAVDDTLKVIKYYQGNVGRMGSASTGTAVVIASDNTGTNTLFKLDPVSGTSNDWNTTAIIGIINSDPVIDVGSRTIWLSTWQYNTGTEVGKIVTWQLNLDNGNIINSVGGGQPPAIIVQQFGGVVNNPIQPSGAFSPDGTIYYVPLMSQDNQGVNHTTIVACNNLGVCDAATSARRWTSTTFNGAINTVYPIAGGNYLAAVGDYQVWFLAAQTGVIANLGQAAIRPSGNLQVLGFQPGLNKEFYVLNGPVSANGSTWPMEIVAVDTPETGEVWRMSYGSGSSPIDGVTMGVDDTGQAWLRVGPDLVKPLALSQYRTARGPTVLP